VAPRNFAAPLTAFLATHALVFMDTESKAPSREATHPMVGDTATHAALPSAGRGTKRRMPDTR
jgi:hypothetical protein